MKTKVKIKSLLAMAGMVFVFVLNSKAENNEIVKAVLLDQKKVLLVVINQDNQRANLNITGYEDSQNLYSDRLKRKSVYRKVFDLSNLPDGKYNLIVDLNDKIYVKVVELVGNTSAMTNETIYYPPDFYAADDILSVRFLNPVKESVYVSFKNELNSFFTDLLPENTGSFQRDYNLKNLDPGKYQVELISGDKNYSYSFEVK